MPKKHSITLYEVENKGLYHEHWLASSALDAARRAIAHAQECSQKLDRVDVSSMVQPEDSRKGGLVYVVNDTRTYAIEHGRVKRAHQPLLDDATLGRAIAGSTNNPNRKDHSNVN